MSHHTDPIADRRSEYLRGSLTEDEAGDDPIALFGRWFEQAHETAAGPEYEASVMTLATVTPENRPAARIVLLKSYDAAGFTFFTNYKSHKGRDLAANPYASLVFHWIHLERQVRIDGKAVKTSRAESEAYFATRPRGSQLGAWVSHQSEAVTRDQLESRLAALEAQYADRPVPCPPHWGGYRVQPQRIEFWQGRANRLHDRIAFVREGAGWKRQRLGP